MIDNKSNSFSFFQSDFVLVAVILLSNKYKVNPDNMATPLAASIGDVVSISMLSFITSILFSNLGELNQKSFEVEWYKYFLSFISYASMDDLRRYRDVLSASSFLDSISITKPLHTTSIKKRMDSGAFSAFHQRVSSFGQSNDFSSNDL